MRINADFQRRVVSYPDQQQWIDSPAPGVQRIMLDRIGEEQARATSLVKYAPFSEFKPHVHHGGEEFLVLQGTFCDEHGRYGAGYYVRNPRGTKHSPYVDQEGAIIFVKLQQFHPEDKQQMAIDTRQSQWTSGVVDGLSVMPLHQSRAEHVALVKWAPYTEFTSHRHWGGEEIYVIEGTFYDEHGCYPKGSWIRSPHLSQHSPFTKQEGAVIYVKTGHLPQT